MKWSDKKYTEAIRPEWKEHMLNVTEWTQLLSTSGSTTALDNDPKQLAIKLHEDLEKTDRFFKVEVEGLQSLTSDGVTDLTPAQVSEKIYGLRKFALLNFMGLVRIVKLINKNLGLKGTDASAFKVGTFTNKIEFTKNDTIRAIAMEYDIQQLSCLQGTSLQSSDSDSVSSETQAVPKSLVNCVVCKSIAVEPLLAPQSQQLTCIQCLLNTHSATDDVANISGGFTLEPVSLAKIVTEYQVADHSDDELTNENDQISSKEIIGLLEQKQRGLNVHLTRSLSLLMVDDEQRKKEMLDDIMILETTHKHKRQWLINILCFFSAMIGLYFFLFALDLMGDAFKVLGGSSAADLFSYVDNPIAGLNVGIFATVLLQSSSTTTSIVVSLVGADIVSVDQAIYMVMGANIGTSITNSIVALGQADDRMNFRRGFAGATVHDFFNFLAVCVLFPTELITGYLEALSGAITDGLVDGNDAGTFQSPLKKWVAPLTDEIIQVDKGKIKDQSKGKEVEGSLIKGGSFASMSDNAAGTLALIISLVVLCVCLFIMVKSLSHIMASSADKWIKKAFNMNGYLAMLVGCGITILVQSSSVTTSALVPVVSLGIVTLEKTYPIMLGANVGTTVTAMLAALVSEKADSIQVAFVHFFFNISGILIWYPIPFMRKVPIALARNLGVIASEHRWFALVYLVGVFCLLPLLFLGFNEAGLAVLIIWTILFVGSVASFATIYMMRKNYPQYLPEFLNDLTWMPEWMRDLYAFEDVFAKNMPYGNKICGDLEKKREEAAVYFREHELQESKKKSMA